MKRFFLIFILIIINLSYIYADKVVIYLGDIETELEYFNTNIEEVKTELIDSSSSEDEETIYEYFPNDHKNIDIVNENLNKMNRNSVEYWLKFGEFLDIDYIINIKIEHGINEKQYLLIYSIYDISNLKLFEHEFIYLNKNNFVNQYKHFLSKILLIEDKNNLIKDKSLNKSIEVISIDNENNIIELSPNITSYGEFFERKKTFIPGIAILSLGFTGIIVSVIPAYLNIEYRDNVDMYYNKIYKDQEDYIDEYYEEYRKTEYTTYAFYATLGSSIGVSVVGIILMTMQQNKFKKFIPNIDIGPDETEISLTINL